MRKLIFRFLTLLCLIPLLARGAFAETAAAKEAATRVGLPPAAGTGIFRNPVVPGATISGYFDHNPASEYVTFHDGRKNNSTGYGFYFSCTNPNMWDFVGCQDNVSGEGSCPNNHELWYDEHHGTDYEFAANWHTGASCDPARFYGITRPIYAPARGKVLMAGTDPSRPANGWHIRLKHDLNGNGDFDDDNFRSVYLHFTANALAVAPGQIVEEGQYLGLGGSTGYSSSPHLHFEVQRSADYFSTTYWPVDPYGWTGSGADPYPYSNIPLWKVPAVDYTNFVYLPHLANMPSELELMRNNGFESGHTIWIEQGVQIINRVGDPSLTVNPNSGSWLSWLGGRSSATDILYQPFPVPDGYPNASLSYYLYISTEDNSTNADILSVDLRTADGSLIKRLDQLSNNFAPTDQWVKRTLALPDLSAFRGQTLRISFQAVTNTYNSTSFYLDDISLIARP